jgi:hypothetical protein
MYNRDKIIQTLKNIVQESKEVEPYVVIAQPKRNSEEIPAQTFDSNPVLHVDTHGYSHGYIDVCGEKVDVARNYLIDQVLQTGAKYLFFIGDDTVVPYDAWNILHKTAEENPGAIIVGVYYIKCGGQMIMVRKGNHVVAPNVDPGQLIDNIWMSGMDCMLIPTDILRKMKEEDPDLPFCCVANGIEGIPFVGEDNFFLHRVRKSGFKVLCNTDVQCLHMDNLTGKYTAHPDVVLEKYFTNIPIADRLKTEDKTFINFRWHSRLPEGGGNAAMPSAFGLYELLKDRESPVGLEIGTSDGVSTEFLLSKLNNLKLFGVDPYSPYTDWNGGVLSKNFQHIIENQFKDRISKYADRYTHFRKTSDECVSSFKDNSLDFVFIDGLHTYEQVKKDLNNYYSKVKPGGIFSGHDYDQIKEVKQAVDEFAKEKGKTISQTEKDVWYWVK